LVAGALLLVIGGCTASVEPEAGAPVPKTRARLSPRVFGDPQCSVAPQTMTWINPFRDQPSTLPFYGDDGKIPVGGSVDGKDVHASIWFEQRLWTLMGMRPDDPDSSFAAHPSTVEGYTWNAVQATPANDYSQSDLDALIAAFANVDPVDASIPQCSYGVPANVAWDPACPSGMCQTDWWISSGGDPTTTTQ
jgi:hypothetical protein